MKTNSETTKSSKGFMMLLYSKTDPIFCGGKIRNIGLNDSEANFT